LLSPVIAYIADYAHDLPRGRPRTLGQARAPISSWAPTASHGLAKTFFVIASLISATGVDPCIVPNGKNTPPAQHGDPKYFEELGEIRCGTGRPPLYEPQTGRPAPTIAKRQIRPTGQRQTTSARNRRDFPATLRCVAQPRASFGATPAVFSNPEPERSAISIVRDILRIESGLDAAQRLERPNHQRGPD